MCKHLILLIVFTASQAFAGASKTHGITGESLVLAAQTPGALLGQDIDADPVVVRSTYPPGKGITYEAGRDYILDATAGTLARTNSSRIPDFATNILFGKKDFD